MQFSAQRFEANFQAEVFTDGKDNARNLWRLWGSSLLRIGTTDAQALPVRGFSNALGTLRIGGEGDP